MARLDGEVQAALWAGAKRRGEGVAAGRAGGLFCLCIKYGPNSGDIVLCQSGGANILCLQYLADLLKVSAPYLDSYGWPRAPTRVATAAIHIQRLRRNIMPLEQGLHLLHIHHRALHNADEFIGGLNGHGALGCGFALLLGQNLGPADQGDIAFGTGSNIRPVFILATGAVHQVWLYSSFHVYLMKWVL